MDEYYKTDRISICSANECTVCGKEFKYRFLKWRFPETPEGLWDMEFKTAHPVCLSLKRRIDQININIDKLLYEKIDLEFELFRKKTN
jgi:hypothetical protein